MKNKIPLIALLLLLAGSFTSCIELVEEITLRKNGSGVYSATLKMGNEAFGLFTEALIQNLGKPDSMNSQSILDQVGALKADTIVELSSLIRSNGSSETLEFLKRAKIRNRKEEVNLNFFSQITFEFNNLNEIAQLGQQIAALFEDESLMDTTAFPYLRSVYQFAVPAIEPEFEWERKTLKRLPVQRHIFKNFLKKLKNDDPKKAEMGTYLIQKFWMFKTIYHLPGKVKSTTFPNSFVDGKTLEVRYDSEVFDAGQSGVIKFK